MTTCDLICDRYTKQYLLNGKNRHHILNNREAYYYYYYYYNSVEKSCKKLWSQGCKRAYWNVKNTITTTYMDSGSVGSTILYNRRGWYLHSLGGCWEISPLSDTPTDRAAVKKANGGELVLTPTGESNGRWRLVGRRNNSYYNRTPPHSSSQPEPSWICVWRQSGALGGGCPSGVVIGEPGPGGCVGYIKGGRNGIYGGGGG